MTDYDKRFLFELTKLIRTCRNITVIISIVIYCMNDISNNSNSIEIQGDSKTLLYGL